MNTLIYFCTLLFFNLKQANCENPELLVSLEQGQIRGRKSHDGNYKYFLGIPYATVDLKNPFGASKPPTRSQDVFDANDGSTECPQSHINLPIHIKFNHHNEALDCLKLNIFAPNEANADNRLPVFLWIHGGGFSGGSAGEEGVPNLVSHGIVVVIINYRLGPYGFFCLDRPAVPGNQGLKDQYDALRWVSKNIVAFGGDPNNITLGGVSAGSCSALFQLYSPKEKLFNKVIAESGVPQVEGMFDIGRVDAATIMANRLGLKTNNTDEALGFLSNSSFQDVTRAMIDSGFRLMPCKEKNFKGIENLVKDNPFSLSNKDHVRDTPILIGHTNNELSLEYGKNNNVEIYFNTIIHLFNFDKIRLQKIVDIVQQFYTGDQNSHLSVDSEEFDSDITFNHPIKRTITNLIQENASPVYAYVFTYVGNSNRTGARHAAETKYLFQRQRPLIDHEDEPSRYDQLVSDRLTTMWANFIKFGNPTPKTTDLLPVIWEKSNTKTYPYLEINEDIKMKNRVFNRRISFWDLFYLANEQYHYLAGS